MMINRTRTHCKEWFDGFTVGSNYRVFHCDKGDYVVNDEGVTILLENLPFK